MSEHRSFSSYEVVADLADHYPTVYVQHSVLYPETPQKGKEITLKCQTGETVNSAYFPQMLRFKLSILDLPPR